MIELLKKSWVKVGSRSLIRDIITTTGWGVIGKAVGFMIPFCIAAWFGVSGETDAFFFVYGLILFISGMFAPVVESVIVPYIAEARVNNDDIGKFVGSILGISGIFILVVTVSVLVVIKPILSLITGFDLKTLNLIYSLLIESSPLVILLIWSSIVAGTLNTYKKFAFPALSPAFRAIINLSVIFLFKDKLGVNAIVLGYVIGEIFRLVILIGIIKRLNLFKLRISLYLDHKLWEFLKTSSYRIIGMSAGGLNLIIDKIMTSWLGEGSVSILSYADRLYMIPVSIMVVGLFPVVLSHWSADYYQKGGKIKFMQEVKGTAKVVLMISIFVVIFLLILYKILISLGLFPGELELKYLHTLQLVFMYYLFGLIPYVVGSIYTRGYLVLKNTFFLMKLAIFNCFLNVILNYILMQFMGVAGIALSTSISALVITILLFLSISSMKIREAS